MPEAGDAELIRAAVGSDWPVIEELAGCDEIARRRILRSHREAGFHSDSDGDIVRLRHRLDDELDRLMLLELGIETGLLDEADVPVRPHLETLFRSNAFGRYLNTYMFFGVRFLGHRVLGAASLDLPADDEGKLNDLPIALPYPPPVPGEAAPAVARWLASRGRTELAADVGMALDFLDDILTVPGEQAQYELWLRGLSSYPANDPHFRRLTRGLLEFAGAKRQFYASLERADRLATWQGFGFARDAWHSRNPLSARFGAIDVYWLARLFRAEVSASGAVTYGRESWLSLLAVHAGAGGDDAGAIAQIDELLRSVFDFTCDLVQNAADIGTDAFRRRQHPDGVPRWPDETACWRHVYDEELEEVTRQRRERRYDEGMDVEALAPDTTAGTDRSRPQWSRRVRTGDHVPDLVGLALSGGGIRSATFNLGVLQHLQELDLLRDVDYLSTVSGGGYIGAWLLGNVRRTHYWLAHLTDWNVSIEHLRRYSNYLAPRAGLMSADSWTMWGSWTRNAVLIQLSAVTWLAVLLVATRMVKHVFALPRFEWLAEYPANLVLGPMLALLTLSICLNLRRQSQTIHETRVLRLAVLPSWIASFTTAAMLWASRDEASVLFSEVLSGAWRPWLAPLVMLFACFWIVSWLSVDPASFEESRVFRVLLGGFAASAALVAVYLGLCGVFWAFRRWGGESGAEWWAYAAGAPLVLFVMTVAVVLIIGLIGRDSPDWRREWWTRFGSWLGIYGVGFLALAVISVFGPAVTLWLFYRPWGAVEWGTVLGWVATVVGGLLSGNSARTDGAEGNWRQHALGLFSTFAAIAFVAGAVLIVSTLLHVLLVQAWTTRLIVQDYWQTLDAIGVGHLGLTLALLLALGLAFSWRFEINVFGLNQFYRNRLVRCYLGATRWRAGLRRPHRFTGFDEHDDLPLSDFRHAAWPDLPYGGPFPIVNCALNLGGSSDLGVHTRRSASFTLTPLRSGADRRHVGYARSDGSHHTFAGGVQLGQAISVSGAAASPNMGHNTAPLVAFLLTMFNVRLAWWFPNPGRRFWNAVWLRFSLWYLVKEMFASADERNYFVNVSDGGHFENLGVYELVRRRCKVIIACDAECDSGLSFGSLGNVVRMCQTDFGARIDIDIESIRPLPGTQTSRAHCAVGRINYANGSRGYLIYLKSSLTGDEDIGIEQYLAANPDFPHQTTGDQFFDEDQFEAYRRLGHHIARLTFRGVRGERDLVAMARRLLDLWIPASLGSPSFVDQAAALDRLLERFRTSPSLHPLLAELTANRQSSLRRAPTEDELCACLELMQHMESVFHSLRLDDFWAHPDNRGWAAMFGTWAKSATFRQVWQRSRGLFGSRFVHFCQQRLGL